MPEEMNAFEGPLDGPLEGLNGQQRIDIDRQSNINTSEFKTRTDANISKVETTLGGQIAKTDEQLKNTSEELSSSIDELGTKTAEQIDDVKGKLEDQFQAVAKVIGLSENEDAPEEVLSALSKFADQQKWAVAVIKDEESSEEDLFTANQIYKQWGETFTVGGFIKYMINPETMKLGTLSTEQYTEYEEAINSMISDKDSIEEAKSEILADAGEELTEEEKQKVAKLDAEISMLESDINRYTDVHPQTGLRITDFDGGMQYWSDKDNESDKAYRENLSMNVVGFGNAKDYYRQLEDRFEAAAEEAQVTLETIRDADENGEPVSEDLRLKGEAANYFGDHFGFVSNMIGVYAFAAYRRTFRMADFTKEAYAEYGNAFEDNKQNVEELTQYLADLESEVEPDEDKIKEVKAKLKKSTMWFEDYACLDEVDGDFVKCNPGYIKWQIDTDDEELESIIKNIEDNVIGYGNAGEYFRELKDRFESAAEEAQVTLETIRDAEENGEPVSEDLMAQGMAANWFIDTFGVIPNLTAVSMFNEHTDDFLMANFTAEVYAEYSNAFEDTKQNVEELTQTLSDLKSEVEPDEDKIKEVKAKLQLSSNKLEQYGCNDKATGELIKCESGFVYFEEERHNIDEESFREENTEVIGLHPATSVTDSNDLKEEFKAEAEKYSEILDSEESTPEEKEEAERFKARFGFRVSAVALASYELFLREEDISESLSLVVSDIERVANDIVRDIERNSRNTKLVNADVYPAPSGEVSQFEVLHLESGEFDVASVALNGIIQKEGIHYSTEGTTINFTSSPSLGSTITVVLHVETSIDLSDVDIDAIGNVAAKLQSGNSYCINNDKRVRNLKGDTADLSAYEAKQSKLKDVAVKSLDELAQLEVDLKATVSDLKLNLSAVEADKSETEKDVADAKAAEQQSKAEMDTLTKESVELNETISKMVSDITNAERSVELNEIRLSVEEGKAFPDQELIDALKAEIKMSDEFIESSSIELESDKAKLEKISKDLKDATSSYESYKREVEDLLMLLEKYTYVAVDIKSQITIFEGYGKLYSIYTSRVEKTKAECESSIDETIAKRAEIDKIIKDIKEDPKCSNNKTA